MCRVREGTVEAPLLRPDRQVWSEASHGGISSRCAPSTSGGGFRRHRLRNLTRSSSLQAVISPDPSSGLSRSAPARRFSLPWSHYARLMTVKSEQARLLRGRGAEGWVKRVPVGPSTGSQFYERTVPNPCRAAGGGGFLVMPLQVVRHTSNLATKSFFSRCV